MKNIDVKMHVRGKSVFVDDIKAPEGLLHAVLFTSPIAKGTIKSLNISEAQNAKNIAAVLTYKDVPGINQIGHIFPDQPFLAVDKLFYVGQPIAIVVGKTRKDAEKAAKLIKLEVNEETPILDVREAYKKGKIYGQKRVLINGDVDSAWGKCEYISEGKLASGGQEHFYFETQRALAVPIEDDTIKVYASAQSPGAYQKHLAEILNLPMHKVELEIRRLGGAFGGKESSAVWVVAPALAAKLLNKPVKLFLTRNEDIKTTGKRHAYEYDYKIGVDKDGKILAYQIDLYQHAGGCGDISVAVLGRSFLHTTNSYNIPNVKISAVSCATNIPPNNAFRGFGVPQGVYSIESAIYQVAEKMGVNAAVIQRKNLLKNGDSLPYGMKLNKTNAIKCWDTLDKQVNINNRIEKVNEYNKNHKDTKKGIAVMPVCFGISFSQTALNQASALVNIYVDGTVSVSTGAVEMGQGVNTKILKVAADTLCIDKSLVRVDTTNTSRIPNASPTSASTGADLNGMAAKMACEELNKRLINFVAQRLNHNADDLKIINGKIYLKDADIGYDWKTLIADAYWARTDLSCHAFYATPGVYINVEKERGRPFAYYSFGTSITEITLDCIRGTYNIDSVDVVHDVGKSLSPHIDKGQIEGAIIQAIGWATIEQIRYSEKGEILTGANSYKIPDIKFCPKTFNVSLLENSVNPFAVCNSKAVGEPPFIHGIGSYFAIINALRNIHKNKPLPSLPITPEKTFMYIYE